MNKAFKTLRRRQEVQKERKRRILVGISALLLKAKILTADAQERNGARILLTKINIKKLSSLLRLTLPMWEVAKVLIFDITIRRPVV